MLLADYAVVSDGKLTIVGGGWSQTGPEPASFGIGLLIQVPWDQANTRHAFSVELLDADGSPIGFEDDDDADQVVAFGGEFEVGRPPGLKPGTPLDFPVAVNSTPTHIRTGPCRSPCVERSSSRPSESVRQDPYARRMARDLSRSPSRIDLLELDIDLRLADLWREAADVSDWSLEIMAAFIRAAYGKGYCDAFTEESPGSLCVDHGYRMPDRRFSERDPAERAA
jgi:hypothetical protein